MRMFGDGKNETEGGAIRYGYIFSHADVSEIFGTLRRFRRTIILSAKAAAAKPAGGREKAL